MVKQAFLFAGQGSQYPGMGKDLYGAFAESRAIFDKADQILGSSFSKLIFEGTAEDLKNTAVSQPAILTMTIAAYEAFRSRVKAEPVFTAGLSLGEYSALVASGSLSFESGLKLVRKRAEIMEEAAKKNPGAMAAVIDLAFEKVAEICLKSGAEIANINSPGQIVISGKKESVKSASVMCAEAGAKRVIELEVSGGFHSSLMIEAAPLLKRAIGMSGLAPSNVPVISNYTAKPESGPLEIEENLVYQLYRPVKWVESVQYIIAQGVVKFYEFGPGKVLKGLTRRIDPAVEVVSIEKPDDINRLIGGGVNAS